MDYEIHVHESGTMEEIVAVDRNLNEIKGPNLMEPTLIFQFTYVLHLPQSS